MLQILFTWVFYLCTLVPLKKKMPLFPWEGLAFEINLFQVVPAFCTFYDFQASIYDTFYFTCQYAALQPGECITHFCVKLTWNFVVY